MKRSSSPSRSGGRSRSPRCRRRAGPSPRTPAGGCATAGRSSRTRRGRGGRACARRRRPRRPARRAAAGVPRSAATSSQAAARRGSDAAGSMIGSCRVRRSWSRRTSRIRRTSGSGSVSSVHATSSSRSSGPTAITVGSRVGQRRVGEPEPDRVERAGAVEAMLVPRPGRQPDRALGRGHPAARGGAHRDHAGADVDELVLVVAVAIDPFPGGAQRRGGRRERCCGGSSDTYRQDTEVATRARGYRDPPWPPLGADQRPPTGQRMRVWATAHAVDDLYQGLVPATVPYFVLERNFSYAAASGLALAATVGSAVPQPLDRVDRGPQAASAGCRRSGSRWPRRGSGLRGRRAQLRRPSGCCCCSPASASRCSTRPRAATPAPRRGQSATAMSYFAAGGSRRVLPRPDARHAGARHLGPERDRALHPARPADGLRAVPPPAPADRPRRRRPARRGRRPAADVRAC